MYYRIAFRTLVLFLTFWISGFAFGGQENSPRVLFTYKDKQYSVSYLTGVSDKDITTVIDDNTPKYNLKNSPRLDSSWLLPAMSPWKPNTEVTKRGFYQHQCQGLLEYFIEFEVFGLFKQRYPVDISRYYSPELVDEAIRRQAELRDRYPTLILAALEKKTSEAEIIKYVRENFPINGWKDRDWVEVILGKSGFRRHQSYYAINRRCFPWIVDGNPVPWVEHFCYSKLIRYHIMAEIERDKPKYIRMLEERFGERNYFLIRRAQDSDKEQLLRLINLVTNRKGEIAKDGVEKVNKTLQSLNSPTRIQVGNGSKLSISKVHKIPEDRTKSRQFISLGKSADGTESYLYIFQEDPTPSFKEYSSAPGNFLYGTAKRHLLQPIVEDVRAAIKPAKGVTLRSIDQIINATGGDKIFFDKLFGIKLPKVVLKDE